MKDDKIMEIYKRTKCKMTTYNEKKVLVKKLGLSEMIEPEILNLYLKKY